MATTETTTKQTLKEVRLLVVRKKGSKGAVDVPWFVEKLPTSPVQAMSAGQGQKDNYEQLEGKVCFIYVVLQLASD